MRLEAIRKERPGIKPPGSKGRDNCKVFSFAAMEDPPLLASMYIVGLNVQIAPDKFVIGTPLLLQNTMKHFLNVSNRS